MSELIGWLLQGNNWLVFPVAFGILYVFATGLSVHARTLARSPSGDHPRLVEEE